MKRMVLILAPLLMLSLIFLGCGSSREGEGLVSVDIAYVGFTVCYNCHADGLQARYPAIVSTWLSGPHANNESLDPNHRIMDLRPENTGFPAYGYEGLGTDPTCTTECHDQLGDGMLIEDLYLESGIDDLGRQNRPLVACESCHGPGGSHFGLGPLGVNNPGPSQCGACHSALFPEGHLPFHPEGGRIYEDYAASPHASSINEHVYAEGSVTDVRAKCSRCHTHQGALRYIRLADGTEGSSDLGDLLDDKAAVEDALSIRCHTCHDPHNPEMLLSARASGLPGAWSAAFSTCTACHQLLKTDGTKNTESYHDPNVNPYGDAGEIITDTHYDDPNTEDIEGYVVDPNAGHQSNVGNTNSGSCLDCHNPHAADNTVNDQWALSGHGDLKGEAWVHYDFKGADRMDCQQCHTATGFRNFANDPNDYDPNDNLFTASGMQKEVLYCWACHTSYTGILRDPGSFALTAPYEEPADLIADVPDIGGSNLCMTCHSGRESGEGLKYLDPNLDIAGKNFGSFNSHYLPAGGILFRTIGYEYAGRDYADVAYFEHDLIGTESAPGTGSNGPCAGCHMRTGEGHTFMPVEKDPNGLITKITADDLTCAECHAGQYAITPEELNELEEGYEDALDALAEQLAADGIHYGTGYPYFFSDPNNQTPANAFTAWLNTDTLGAAFNLNMLVHMPGAHIHNRFYTKRLLYDSIDFVDDGVLNWSVNLTIGTSRPAYGFLEGTRP
ncbi:MAG: hypothetical protein ACMUIS_08340 [bacterium]